IRSLLAPRRGPERLLDLLLRTGPYGDAFGANPSGLSLAVLEANPHGIDLGPLEPRIPEVLRTPSGRIELAPEPIAADVERLRARGREQHPPRRRARPRPALGQRRAEWPAGRAGARGAARVAVDGRDCPG